ncbi:hypothetical protein RN001_012273 [Aquatica leii]|uniref:Superoxide dismutase [Cu-Zn] n=1 Tax=Aquatica leii TaxID=1421715 RepID=A0AAN7S7P8_9COLE|nr:hypothetical protein RN001_012273 [Aquatica leii]
MYIILTFLIFTCFEVSISGLYPDRHLLIKSYPAIQNVQSDLYEVYQEPYFYDVSVASAVAIIHAEGDGDIKGEIMFTQRHPPTGPVFIKGNITGLPNGGKNGLHIYQSGDLRHGCEKLGGHFNPYLLQHGGPKDAIRHVGDLGNVNAKEDGTATIELVDPLLSLVGGLRGIVGRAIVVTENEDDLGRGGTAESLTTGSSGKPIAAQFGGTLTEMLRILSLSCLIVCALANPQAVVNIRGDTISGDIKFTQLNDGVLLEGEIVGLKPGNHGFHIHVFGDISNGCLAAGPHFNPYAKTHGSPSAHNRHVGDLGNIVAGPDGVAKIQIKDHQISLGGETCIIGRAVVVHAGEDDLGLGGNEESLKTGNAGGRLGCGVIGTLSESSSTYQAVPLAKIIFGLLAIVVFYTTKITL